MEQQYAGQDTVQFTDRLLFLVARKPREAAPAGASGGAAAEPSQAAAAAQQQQGAQPPQQTEAQQQQQQQQQQQARNVLSPAQRQQYREEGLTGPISVLSPEEAAALRQQFERYEQRLGGKITGDWRFKVSSRLAGAAFGKRVLQVHSVCSARLGRAASQGLGCRLPADLGAASPPMLWPHSRTCCCRRCGTL